MTSRDAIVPSLRWITNSDDEDNANLTDPRKYYALDYNADEGRWYLPGYSTTDPCYVRGVTALAPKSVVVSDPITV